MHVHLRSMVAVAALAGLGATGYVAMDRPAVPQVEMHQGDSYLVDITNEGDCRVTPAVQTPGGWAPAQGWATTTNPGAVLLHATLSPSPPSSEYQVESHWHTAATSPLALTDERPVQDVCTKTQHMGGGYILLNAQGQPDTNPSLTGYDQSADQTLQAMFEGPGMPPL